MAERTFTAREKQKAAAREVSQRQRVYPRLVDAGRLKQAEAERQIAVMQSIEADYRKLAETEDAAGRLL